MNLANITKTSPNALYRLLRMLASVGIFRETTKVGAGREHDKQNTVRRFDLTPAAFLLLSETTNSIRDFALLFGLDSFNRATTNLLHAIETGENSFKYANGMDLFEYFQQKQNETDAEAFDNAMNSLNLSYVSTIFTLYDFSQFKTILDIGGGQGVFLSTILKKNPNQLGILFDMPKVIQRAKKKYWTSGAKPFDDHDNSLYSRCKLVKGNFFKTIPSGADCNIIKNVILNWDDESASIDPEKLLTCYEKD